MSGYADSNPAQEVILIDHAVENVDEVAVINHPEPAKEEEKTKKPMHPRTRKIATLGALCIGLALVVLAPSFIAVGVSLLLFPNPEAAARIQAVRAFSASIENWKTTSHSIFANSTSDGSIETSGLDLISNEVSFSSPAAYGSSSTSFTELYLSTGSFGGLSLGEKYVVRDDFVGEGEGGTVLFTDGIVKNDVGVGLPLFLWGSEKIEGIGSGAQTKCRKKGGDFVEQMYGEARTEDNCFWYYRLDRLCFLVDPKTGHPMSLSGDEAESHGCYETQAFHPASGIPSIFYSVGAYSVVSDVSTHWSNYEIPIEVRSPSDPELALNSIVDFAVKVRDAEVYFETWGDDSSSVSSYVSDGVFAIVLLTGGIGMFVLLGVLVFIQFACLRKWTEQEVAAERLRVAEKKAAKKEARGEAAATCSPHRVFDTRYVPAKWVLNGVGESRQSMDPHCETYVIGSNTNTIPVYVLSDLHLRDDNLAGPHRKRLMGMFADLAQTVGPKVGPFDKAIVPTAYLVLLGDIFDEWVQRYDKPMTLRKVIIKHQWFVSQLLELRTHGILTVYVKGDKDVALTKELCHDPNLFHGAVYYGGERLIMGDVVFEHGNRYDLCATSRYGDYMASEDGPRWPVGYFISRMSANRQQRDVWYHPLRAIFVEWLRRQPRGSQHDLESALETIRRISFPRLVGHLSKRDVPLAGRIVIDSRTEVHVQNLFDEVDEREPYFSKLMLLDHVADGVGVPGVFETSTLLPLFCKTRVPRHVEYEMRIGIVGGLGILDDVPKRFSPHFSVVVLAHTHRPVIKLMDDDDGYPLLYANSGSCEDSLADWSMLKVLSNVDGKHRVERLRLSGDRVEGYRLERVKSVEIDKRTARWYHGRARSHKFAVRGAAQDLVADPSSFLLPGFPQSATVKCGGHVPGSLTSMETCALNPRRSPGRIEEREVLDRGWDALTESYPKLRQLFEETRRGPGRDCPICEMLSALLALTWCFLGSSLASGDFSWNRRRDSAESGIQNFEHEGFHLPPSSESRFNRPSTDWNVTNNALNVLDYGAIPDGKTDCTAAFRNALNDAGKQTQGNVVIVPSGQYLLTGPLDLPRDTILRGIFEHPISGQYKGGSLLLTTWGEGKENETPFLSLHENAAVVGLMIYYPNQKQPTPVPYPWTIRQVGDNIGIRNVQIVNPWNAVDCGSVTGGRHFIKGLYAQPLNIGLYIDNCFDIGRVEDVHFWPFWSISMMKWTEANAVAYKIGRTDWEYIENCFGIAYKTGWHFSNFSKAGPGNVVLVNSGADEPGLSVLVEATESHAGISFVNGQFMGGIHITETNVGPVKFANCGFWGMGLPLDTHLIVEGGHVTLTGTHFIYWANTDPHAPAISVSGNSVVAVTGCDFMDSGKVQMVVSENAKGVVFVGNLCAGEVNIKKLTTKVELVGNLPY